MGWNNDQWNSLQATKTTQTRVCVHVFMHALSVCDHAGNSNECQSGQLRQRLRERWTARGMKKGTTTPPGVGGGWDHGSRGSVRAALSHPDRLHRCSPYSLHRASSVSSVQLCMTGAASQLAQTLPPITKVNDALVEYNANIHPCFQNTYTFFKMSLKGGYCSHFIIKSYRTA